MHNNAKVKFYSTFVKSIVRIFNKKNKTKKLFISIKVKSSLRNNFDL